MAYTSRPTSMLPPGNSGTSLRQPNDHGISQQQSSALTTRIASKKAELENLRQLRDLSATLATQMQTLEDKIGTLNDGTEAVACVLANWDNVLRAISMASTKAVNLKDSTEPDASSSGGIGEGDTQTDAPLPATLVRIPAEQQEKTSE